MAANPVRHDFRAVARTSVKTDADGTLVKLGEAIREQRKAAGLSQEALADAAEVDRSHMSQIERGKRNVTILNLVKIAAAIGSPLSKVIERAGL